MNKENFNRLALGTIALSMLVIASVQLGVITPAYAISNNVVVSKIVNALRSDHQELANIIQTSCR